MNAFIIKGFRTRKPTITPHSEFRKRTDCMNPEIKKRLLECGYDYGFECPHFDSTDTYPDYLMTSKSKIPYIATANLFLAE